MILLTSTTDKVQVVTATAVSSIYMHATWIDNSSGTISGGRNNQVTGSATTIDLIPSPSAGVLRNLKFLTVRNTNTTTSCTITVQHTDGTTAVPIWFGVLGPNQTLQIADDGTSQLISSSGQPITSVSASGLINFSTTSQGPGFATDTYLTGSNIQIPSSRPRAGTMFQCLFAMTKTAAGTATPIVTLRYGSTAGVTDTALCTFTFGAGTAAVDTGTFVVTGVYRSIGSGTAAVVQGICQLDSSATTGFSSTVKSVVVTSAGHDSTSSQYLGVSVNGGTSAAWTCVAVNSTLMNI